MPNIMNMLNNMNMYKYKLFFIFIVFMLGLYFVLNYPTIESFSTANKSYRCANILIQKGSSYFLFNSKLAKIPGVNPLRFNNLEDYVEFTDWQRSQGIRCPILYVQETYDAQGNPVYNARPSPTDLQGGLQPQLQSQQPSSQYSQLIDASRDSIPFNQNGYPAFDPHDQMIGLITPLDKMFHEKSNGVSPNPMDKNWGGIKYTQSLIDSGYYAGNEVAIKVA
jgi:hypothetical protein